jgi:hypothetical protein
MYAPSCGQVVSPPVVGGVAVVDGALHQPVLSESGLAIANDDASVREVALHVDSEHVGEPVAGHGGARLGKPSRRHASKSCSYATRSTSVIA